ncbi:ABC transporter permease [Frigoriflavimonas asaccharolytica]|uniref:ABC-2 type transport system permease protein n=1 Tax=Frigoriflavimonas asaccharolytica TaxID=2735899 RepID=A0A8J8KAZ3_9FLAO|nr:ABC transporter permease [Frigoriflavimonas asaccharolytica]NRS91999.1 ABC-2 type transport system permease protein [Frigoriflavimonas asaccharolytica]
MRNIILITKREYLTQVKKKSFILLTILAPIMMLAFGAFIAFMFKANETQHTINVIDKSGIFAGKLKSDETVKYILIPADLEKQMVAGLKDMESIDGLLILGNLPKNNLDGLEKKSKLLVNSKIGFETKQHIISDISKVLRAEKIKNLKLDETQITNIDKKFELASQNVSDDKDLDSDLSFGVKYGLSLVLMYATFMFIIIYGVRVMRSVLEEKNNRVVEIIISSVKPFQLMMGKIIGVTMVALTQFIVWIIMAVAGALVLNTGFSTLQKSASQAEELTGKMDFQQIAVEASHHLLELNFPLIIVVFIFFFLFGYIFYSSIYAAIGSAVDNETETQQFTMFAIIPLMIGVYGSFTIINNPDGPMGFWLSIIPFTSPVAMVARIPFGVPAWQIALSMTLLLISALFMIFVASKIYKVGILMYGNKATLKELWKWIRN